MTNCIPILITSQNSSVYEVINKQHCLIPTSEWSKKSLKAGGQSGDLLIDHELLKANCYDTKSYY